jgi:hypothetical protein
VPPWASVRIVERTSYDIAPVDPPRPTGSGGAASPARRPKPSPASPWQKARTVLHSVTWQYLSGGEQAGVRNGTDALAAGADSRAPFVHLMREPQRRTPDAVHEFLVRARSWPDGADPGRVRAARAAGELGLRKRRRFLPPTPSEFDRPRRR